MSLTITTTVDASHSLTVAVPGLDPGQAVRVTVETISASAVPPRTIEKDGFEAWIKSLPSSTRSREEWDESPKQMRKERDEWDRES